jgi:hypothetical protein
MNFILTIITLACLYYFFKGVFSGENKDFYAWLGFGLVLIVLGLILT